MERTAAAIMLACAACGSRTALDILGGGHQDATGPEVGIDASGPEVGIGVPGPDVGIEAAETACSTTIGVIQDCEKGDPSCCRFDAIWTCGNQSFTVEGYCGPQGGWAICPPSNQQLKGPSPLPCHCDDPNALSAFVETLCHPAVQ